MVHFLFHLHSRLQHVFLLLFTLINTKYHYLISTPELFPQLIFLEVSSQIFLPMQLSGGINPLFQTAPPQRLLRQMAANRRFARQHQRTLLAH